MKENISLKESTKKEVEAMIQAGAEQISYKELLKRLNDLGYTFDSECSFVYTNRLNKRPFKAKSLYVIEKDTKKSFAHVNSRRDDNFKKLQKLRLDTICLHRNMIISL